MIKILRLIFFKKKLIQRLSYWISLLYLHPLSEGSLLRKRVDDEPRKKVQKKY